MTSQFIRKTTLAHDEYQTNFTITDNDIIDVLTSDEALGQTTLMPAIYFRMKRAAVDLWEREGVLHFRGGDEDGKVITAWEQMRRLTSVSNSTLSKAVKWMHEKGVIGYVAHKNGIGIRIFFNRAAASIRYREGQKNLRLVPAPSANDPAPQNGMPFKEGKSEINQEIKGIPRASARGPHSGQEQPAMSASSHTEKATGQGSLPGPATLVVPDTRLVTLLIRQVVAELKPEITAVVKRETEVTREWFLNHGLPKAMRVAQRETCDLLRAYGVLAKKGGHSADVGKCAAPAETGQGREAEISRVATFIAEADKVIQQVINAASESPKLTAACRTASRELNELYDRIAAHMLLTPEEIEDKLAVIDDTLMKAAWEAVDPGEGERRLRTARAELRGYQPRMERAAFEETVRRRATIRLREELGLPRLSLFYL